MQNYSIFCGHFLKKYFFVEKLGQLEKMFVVQKKNKNVLTYMF